MIPQAWIVLVAFAVVIVYSVVMTIQSENFRQIVRLNTSSMIIFFFIALFVLAVLTVFGVECSISGAFGNKMCTVYSWVMSFLIAIVVVVFLIRSIMTVQSRSALVREEHRRL